MAEEENNEQVEETPETAPEEAVAEQAAPPEEDSGQSTEAEEPKTPRERRKASRSAHTGEAGPQRSVDDRVKARAEARAQKAKQRSSYRARVRERKGATPASEPTPPEPKAEGKLKLRQGVVVSDKGNKTITVRIDTARQHRKYGKIVRRSSTLHAHDEENEANTGDTVRVIESRPLSKTKRWRLVDVLERAR